ncbi:MAG: folate-binding protein YgfZ [Gemmatimonadaceae bacterium]|nr:folate-binding protein YgfZ [Gemmatimonadaceae bacterium]
MNVLPDDTLAREYATLHAGALLVWLPERSLGVFRGAKAAEVLNGLVSNEVAALAPGEGNYAVALTPRGKILADVRVLRLADAVMVDVPGPAATGWWGMVRKYVNPRLAQYEELSPTLTALGVYGPSAADALGQALGVQAIGLAPYAHASVALGEATATVASIPDAGVPGFVIYLPNAASAAAHATLQSAGAQPGSIATLEVARVEAGRPAWGIDMDDTTLTQEARLDDLGAVSYSKGCYTGQETVARLHFRGHVNRLLRGVSFERGSVARGAALVGAEGNVVGEVRSVVRSPRLGDIGLAMVRREVEPGTTVMARTDASVDGIAARVLRLPFPSSAPPTAG